MIGASGSIVGASGTPGPKWITPSATGLSSISPFPASVSFSSAGSPGPRWITSSATGLSSVSSFPVSVSFSGSFSVVSVVSVFNVLSFFLSFLFLMMK